jgi:hypothetical protein
MRMYAIDCIAIHSVDDLYSWWWWWWAQGGRCYSQQCQTNMRQTMCHQQALGFSPIFNHWPARHCYFQPLRGTVYAPYHYYKAYTWHLSNPQSTNLGSNPPNVQSHPPNWWIGLHIHKIHKIHNPYGALDVRIKIAGLIWLHIWNRLRDTSTQNTCLRRRERVVMHFFCIYIFHLHFSLPYLYNAVNPLFMM